ncbi:MAG TPA: hypothetical protein VNX01_07690 [Bacteroidia bacterium]|jgi:hypothetical protein|nr:hypothetical protein [Bacteroidia bacterium]
MQYQTNYPWENKHKNVHFTVNRLYDALNRLADGTKPVDITARWHSGIDCLKSILKDAEQGNGNVRGGGGGWSLSEVTKTTDYFVNTQPLNIIYVGLDKTFIGNGEDPTLFVLMNYNLLFNANQ